MSEKEKILLLNCPPDFRSSLDKKRYQADQGHICDIKFSIVKYNREANATTNYPLRPYNYDYVVYCPDGSVVNHQIMLGMIADNNRSYPFPDFLDSIQGGVICVVFLNKDCKNIERLKEVVPGSIGTYSIYSLFCLYLEEYLIEDDKTQFALGKVANLLKPVLRDCVSEESLVFPLISMKKRHEKFNTDFLFHPILTNRAGHYHAVWVKHGAGGILYLPEFKNNLEVLTALLKLPLSKLLEINAKFPHHRDKESEIGKDAYQASHSNDVGSEVAMPPDPLPKAPRLLYEKLKSLKPHEAMTTDEILDWLSGKYNKQICESTLSETYLKPLKPYGLKNKPKTGYYIRED